MRSFLVVFILAWVVGIGAGVRGGIISLIMASALALVFLWVSRVSRGASGSRQAAWILAALSLASLGWLWGTTPSHTDKADCPPGKTMLTATIIRLESAKEKTTTYLIAHEHCQLIVTLPHFPEYSIGSVIELSGTVQPVSAVATRSAGYAAYLDRRGIGGTMSFPTVRLITAHATPHTRILQRLTQHINVAFVEPEASFVRAMLLAEPGSLPPELQDQFRRTGLTHLVAISGLNISLMATSLLLVLWLLPLSAGVRSVILATFIWAYIWLIDFPVSATRAAWFWTLVLFGFRAHWLVSLPTGILMAGVLLLTHQPSLIADISFQLSMAAVIGIGIVVFLTDVTTESSWRRFLIAVFGATVGATLMTAPIIIYHFGTLSLVSIIANVLVEPVFPFLLLTALLTVAVSFILPGVPLIGSWLFHAGFWWMDTVTRTLSAVPYGYLTDLTLPVWGYVLYYAALAAISGFIVSRQKRSWREMWQ